MEDRIIEASRHLIPVVEYNPQEGFTFDDLADIFNKSFADMSMAYRRRELAMRELRGILNSVPAIEFYFKEVVPEIAKDLL